MTFFLFKLACKILHHSCLHSLRYLQYYKILGAWCCEEGYQATRYKYVRQFLLILLLSSWKDLKENLTMISENVGHELPTVYHLRPTDLRSVKSMFMVYLFMTFRSFQTPSLLCEILYYLVQYAVVWWEIWIYNWHKRNSLSGFLPYFTLVMFNLSTYLKLKKIQVWKSSSLKSNQIIDDILCFSKKNMRDLLCNKQTREKKK